MSPLQVHAQNNSGSESTPPIRGPVLKLLMYALPKHQTHLGPSTVNGAGLPFGQTPSPQVALWRRQE